MSGHGLPDLSHARFRQKTGETRICLPRAFQNQTEMTPPLKAKLDGMKDRGACFTGLCPGGVNRGAERPEAERLWKSAKYREVKMGRENRKL